MMEILPYKKGLLKDFVYNGVEAKMTGEAVQDIVDFYANLGTCYVGRADNRILGVAGIYPLWKNYGGCFLFMNKEARIYKKSIFKAILGQMEKWIDIYRIKTMTADCLNNPEAANLIEHLGFKKGKEVTMKIYTRET